VSIREPLRQLLSKHETCYWYTELVIVYSGVLRTSTACVTPIVPSTLVRAHSMERIVLQCYKYCNYETTSYMKVCLNRKSNLFAGSPTYWVKYEFVTVLVPPNIDAVDDRQKRRHLLHIYARISLFVVICININCRHKTKIAS
jgi:hypothetical protein